MSAKANGFCSRLSPRSFQAAVARLNFCKLERRINSSEPPKFEFYGKYFRFNLLIDTSSFGFAKSKI